MKHAKRLPQNLVKRYHGWKATSLPTIARGTATWPRKGSIPVPW